MVGYSKYIFSILLFFLVLPSEKTYAQFQLLDTKAQVDTMSLAERFSFHTNAVDWICEMPNAQVEFDLGKTNWNNWSILVGGRISVPSIWTKINPYYVWDNKEVHMELRNYWRSSKSRLSTVFYWGLRASTGSYDIKLKDFGNRGKFVFGGLSLGLVKQLYGYPSGNSVDLELGITAGCYYSNNTKYHRTSKDVYRNDKSTAKRLVIEPKINEVRVGLIYRFGNFPISRKYRPRYYTDMQYHNAFDDYVARLRQQYIDKHNADSLFKMSYSYFAQQFDSIYRVKAAEEKEAHRIAKEEYRQEVLAKKAAIAEAKRKQEEAKRAEKLALKEQKRQAKEARKKEKADKKAAQKAAKKASKEAAKKAKEAAKKAEQEKKAAAKAAKNAKKESNS